MGNPNRDQAVLKPPGLRPILVGQAVEGKMAHAEDDIARLE